MNKVSLIGHLCQNAEQNTTQDGRSYIKMRIAVNHRVKGQEQAMFITAFSQSRADGILPYLTKGKQVYIDGTFTLSVYQDKSGTAQPVMTVNAFTIELLGSREQNQAQQQQAQAPQQNNNPFPNPGVTNDGLPF